MIYDSKSMKALLAEPPSVLVALDPVSLHLQSEANTLEVLHTALWYLGVRGESIKLPELKDAWRDVRNGFHPGGIIERSQVLRGDTPSPTLVEDEQHLRTLLSDLLEISIIDKIDLQAVVNVQIQFRLLERLYNPPKTTPKTFYSEVLLQAKADQIMKATERVERTIREKSLGLLKETDLQVGWQIILREARTGGLLSRLRQGHYFRVRSDSDMTLLNLIDEELKKIEVYVNEQSYSRRGNDGSYEFVPSSGAPLREIYEDSRSLGRTAHSSRHRVFTFRQRKIYGILAPGALAP